MKDKRTGCGDPDCTACTTARGERPASPIMREFAGVYAQMQAAEDGVERRMTFALSGASLIFLAFLDRLAEAQGRPGRMHLVPGIIDLDDPVEQARAGRFLAHMIPAVLDEQLRGVMSGEHPLLAPLPSVDGGTTVH